MAIPKCKYIIRKGESPCPKRSNIFDWSPVLAEKEDKFEEYKEDIPPLVKPTLSEYQQPELPPVNEVKKILISEAIKKLEKEDFTKAGVPKTSSLTNLVGFDVTKEMRDEAFEYLQSEFKRTNGRNLT